MPLRDKLLKALEVHRDTPVSGQALATQFFVSRTAIWKAVNELKSQGYQIESAPNRGYQLAHDDDHLSASAISRYLDRPCPVYAFDTVDSTLNEAKRRLGDEKCFLIVADSQTAGRGRRGRQFYSPKGSGLYLTLAMPLHFSVEAAPTITAYAAVCVCQAIETLTGKQGKIKWVNDVFLDGKKICGILTEASTSLESGMIEAVIIGIGINVNSCELPEDLKDIVGFLQPDIPIRNRLAAEIANKLLAFSQKQSTFLNDYRARSLSIGRRVRCTVGSETFLATGIGIDATGGLIVRTDDGKERTLHSGEAKLI
ncbi:MAG TPA: biotin--[acetyl-CoA-carboxylase] ligase [Candidatus Limiplasma sp.]|nr:biotin--[acetyl-CoA-carboxylase] ligase [Candidatus Limiplasma sp.]